MPKEDMWKTIATVFVVLGAINWALLGLLGINLVNWVNSIPYAAGAVYLAIGLSGLYVAYNEWM